MVVIEADFEIPELGIVVSQDLVISVDPNTDAVIQGEVMELDGENEQHVAIDGLVKLV